MTSACPRDAPRGRYNSPVALIFAVLLNVCVMFGFVGEAFVLAPARHIVNIPRAGGSLKSVCRCRRADVACPSLRMHVIGQVAEGAAMKTGMTVDTKTVVYPPDVSTVYK